MGYFIGHLHPAFVHLPIGFIILALLSDFYVKRNSGNSSHSLSTFFWIASAVAALFAMGTGIVALKSGYYEGANMFIHLLCGYGITIVTSLIAFTKWKDKQWFSKQGIVFKSALLGLLIVGGHKGGELTHGPEYLPTPFSKSETVELADLDALDTIDMFDDMIAPVFHTKCNRCHETDDARGKLNMTTQEGLLDDTYGDPGIFPGNLGDSEIFKRITLNPSHRKYMPPSGPDLSYKEKKLIEWWILQGAPFGSNLREMEVDPAMKEFLKSQYGLDLRQKSFYEKMNIEPADQSAIENIKTAQFNATQLAANNNFIDVTRIGKPADITSEEMSSLLEAKQHVTWLDLSGSDASDDVMKVIGQLENLTKLKLQNTNITDAALDQLSSLEHLSVLNIYGTNVSDAGLEQLTGLRNLKQVYVWQTKVTQAGIDRLQSALPSVEVISGCELKDAKRSGESPIS